MSSETGRPGSETVTTQTPTTARVVSGKRSVVKALSYRLIIICLDFLTVYLFTGAVRIAFGFMIVSNLYTTILYVVHERVWARIQWGVNPHAL